MSPPIDIDGSEIQEATIDGQDVSEITIDGQQAAELLGIPDSALRRDLVAWYRFEDGDARDYTATLDAQFADSTAYDGTVDGAAFQSTGGVTDFENGGNSGAFDFDGSNDKIELPVGTQVDDFSSGGFSFGCWFNINSSNMNDDSAQIVGNYGDSEYGCTDNHIQLTSDRDSNKVELAIRDRIGQDTFRIITSSTEVLDGNWHHGVGTIQSNDTMTLYVDGNNEGSVSVSSIEDWAEQPNFYVGEDGCKTKNMPGKVDDIRLYNKELSSTEVSDIYNATKP